MQKQALIAIAGLLLVTQSNHAQQDNNLKRAREEECARINAALVKVLIAPEVELAQKLLDKTATKEDVIKLQEILQKRQSLLDSSKQ